MKPLVISIVGKSDSGKTTLLERIIPRLDQRGIAVGVVKHDAHSFEIDHPGKDTYRHFHAGADRVAILSAEKIALIRRTAHELTLDELIESYFSDLELVLTEGFKRLDKPKIEVFRPELHNAPLCTLEDNLLAFVTTANDLAAVPHFAPDQYEAIVDFIVNQLKRY